MSEKKVCAIRFWQKKHKKSPLTGDDTRTQNVRLDKNLFFRETVKSGLMLLTPIKNIGIVAVSK